MYLYVPVLSFILASQYILIVSQSYEYCWDPQLVVHVPAGSHTTTPRYTVLLVQYSCRQCLHVCVCYYSLFIHSTTGIYQQPTVPVLDLARSSRYNSTSQIQLVPGTQVLATGSSNRSTGAIQISQIYRSQIDLLPGTVLVITRVPASSQALILEPVQLATVLDLARSSTAGTRSSMYQQYRQLYLSLQLWYVQVHVPTCRILQ